MDSVQVAIKDTFNTKGLMQASVAHAKTFDEIKEGALSALRLSSNLTISGRVWYLSAIITSLGYERMEEMTIRLEDLTAQLRSNVAVFPFPIFSSSDIFPSSGALEAKLKANGEKLSQDNFNNFWDGLLRPGFVTDMFMTPLWHISNGAKLENEVAKDVGMIIHFYEQISTGSQATYNGRVFAVTPIQTHLVIYNSSTKSIEEKYTTPRTMPFYTENPQIMAQDLKILRRLGPDIAEELATTIERSLRMKENYARREQSRYDASKAAFEEYYSA